MDDMFVVIEAWKNLSPEENALPIPLKIATTMKQAGVSITITSVTNAVAFGIGATTVCVLQPAPTFRVLSVIFVIFLAISFHLALLSAACHHFKVLLVMFHHLGVFYVIFTTACCY